jgi:probable rRNA maturation factor
MAVVREPAAPRAAELTVEFSSSVSCWTPSARQVARWARAAVGARGRGATLAVRTVGLVAGRRLNRVYRGRDYATNVLSFAGPVAAPGLSLGDLVISAPVVAREARRQCKPLQAHWAHLIVHGCLHLLGFDHEKPAAARRMEQRERAVLASFGIEDPYREAVGPRHRSAGARASRSLRLRHAPRRSNTHGLGDGVAAGEGA